MDIVNSWSVFKAQNIAYKVAENYNLETPLVLIRFGENAVYKTHDEKYIIRVHRNDDTENKISKEVEIAKKLRDFGTSTNQLSEIEASQPILVDNSHVTIWNFIETESEEHDWEKIGLELKKFHQNLTTIANNSPKIQKMIPEFNPFKRMHYWLEKAWDKKNIKEYDKKVLEEKFVELRKKFIKNDLLMQNEFTGFPYMHGDFYVGNILNGKNGPVFIDFELISKGPSFWDLVLISASNKRFNMTDYEYSLFCEAYGYDVRNWSKYELAMDIFELNAILWLTQNIDLSTQKIALEEFNHRIKNWTVGHNNDKWLISKEL